MNSKEFITKLIDFTKEQINYYENKIVEDEQYPSLQQCHKEELIASQEGLAHLSQIKQDLDRLEKLEKENKILLVNKNAAQGIAKRFKEENNRLKKVIEGLNECFDFEIDDETETLYCCLGDITGIDIEFLQLLKEVLENE